jgi:hypothetical protein
MALRELGKAQVLAVRPSATGDETLERCFAALEADTREVFTVDTAPADVLRKNLEVKYRIARQRGKRFIGDSELLLALSDLGDALVTSVFLDQASEHFDVFLAINPLRPVGAVIMKD